MQGKRIVLCASRKTEEMTALIEKQGGIALIRPAQGTVFAKDEALIEEIRDVISQTSDWFIFTTGVGVEALIEAAERGGMKEKWLEAIQAANVAVRGYKTVAALKKIGIPIVAESDDGTTKGLLRSLSSFSFAGKRVVVQLHGDTAPTLKQFMLESGALYTELLPYRHIAPDEDVLNVLYNEIVEQQVDAVCFTTAMQVRFLFSFAKEKRAVEPLCRAFSEHVVACAVGTVTAEALLEEGVTRIVAPELERMGAMIVTLAKYFAS